MDGSGSGMEYFNFEDGQNFDNIGRIGEEVGIRNIEFQFPLPQIIGHLKTEQANPIQESNQILLTDSERTKDINIRFDPSNTINHPDPISIESERVAKNNAIESFEARPIRVFHGNHTTMRDTAKDAVATKEDINSKFQEDKIVYHLEEKSDRFVVSDRVVKKDMTLLLNNLKPEAERVKTRTFKEKGKSATSSGIDHRA